MSVPTKAEARSRIRAARAALDDAELSRRSRMLTSVLQQHVHPDAVVTGYLPMHGEPDLLPFLQLHAARKAPVYLPVVPRQGRHLGWEAWHPDMPMREHTALPLLEPDPGPEGPGDLEAVVRAAAEANRGVPRTRDRRQDPAQLVLLVPALAVDTTGARLGQGGGYYDTSMSRLPAILKQHPELRCEVIVVVHSEEVLPPGAFPVQPHDLRTAQIATEYRLSDVSAYNWHSRP